MPETRKYEIDAAIRNGPRVFTEDYYKTLFLNYVDMDDVGMGEIATCI